MSEKKEITIRMPKAKLAKWLKALRTGGYRQTTKGTLYDPKTGAFCCLGVLQHCLSSGQVEVNEDGDYRGLPSAAWLAQEGILFTGTLKVGTPTSPWLPTLDITAHAANDTGRKFKTLANAIEACAEGY